MVDTLRPREPSGRRIPTPSHPHQKPLAVKCPACRELLCYHDYEKNLKVCPVCDYHFRLTAYERIHLLVDPDSFVEIDVDFPATNLSQDLDQSQAYREHLPEEQDGSLTGDPVRLNKTVVAGYASIECQPLVLAIMSAHPLRGGTETAVSEKITRTVETAIERHLPLFISSASAGMRAQRGVPTIMQMAKTSAAMAALGRAGLPYISLLTDPTSGGIAASFAMLGDVLLAESGTLICLGNLPPFEQDRTVKPLEGATTADILFQHGLLDAVVPRRKLRNTLAQLLRLYALDETKNRLPLRTTANFPVNF